jgi:hypothetical protein
VVGGLSAALLLQPRVLVVLVNFLLGLGLGYVSFKALKHVSVFVVMLLSSFLLSNVMLGLAPVSELRELALAFSRTFGRRPRTIAFACRGWL